MTLKETTSSSAVNPAGLIPSTFSVSKVYKDLKHSKMYQQFWYKMQKQLLGLSGLRHLEADQDMSVGKYLNVVYNLMSHAHAMKGNDPRVNEILDSYLQDLDKVAKALAADPDVDEEEFRELYSLLAGTLEGIRNCEETGFVVDGIAEEPEGENSEDPVEEASYTKGMVKAYDKLRLKLKCSSCGVIVPVYPGRYPKNCPNCAATFRPFREPAEGGSGGPSGHVPVKFKTPDINKQAKFPEALTRIRETAILEEIRKRPNLLRAIQSLDPKSPDLHMALKCYNTVMTRVIIEDERGDTGLLSPVIPGMLMEMLSLLAGRDEEAILERFKEVFASGKSGIQEREVPRKEFLKVVMGAKKEEGDQVVTYRDSESSRVVGQEILRPGKAPVYIVSEQKGSGSKEAKAKKIMNWVMRRGTVTPHDILSKWGLSLKLSDWIYRSVAVQAFGPGGKGIDWAVSQVAKKLP